MSTFTRSGLFTPFTPVFNATGQPGISLPLYEGEDGLPLGVQIVGAPAGEERLLALATSSKPPSPGPIAGRRSGRRYRARPPARVPRSGRLEHSRHPLRADAQRLRVGAATAARASRPPSARPRPRSRTLRGPIARSSRRSDARDERRRNVHERPVAAAAPAAPCGRSPCGSASPVRPARSGGGAGRRLAQRGGDAVGDILGPDRLEAGAPASGHRHQRAAAPSVRAASARGRPGA